MSKPPPPAPTASAPALEVHPGPSHHPNTLRKRREKIEESKNVQTTPTRTYCKRNRPLPYYHPNCRTPRHWKFTQNHRTTRPPPSEKEERRQRRVKMSKQPPPAPTASEVGPCPTIIEIVGRPGTGSLVRNLRTTRPPPFWQ